MELVSAGRIRSIRSVAPEVASWLDEAWAATERLDPALLALMRGRVVAGSGSVANDPGADPVAGAMTRVVDDFVRFVPDVSADAIAVLYDHLGRRETRELIEALWVYDQAARLQLSHRALFGAYDGGIDAAPAETSPRAGVPPTVGGANGEFHHAVMRLTGMDLETTELVRLRAGFHHRCRNCRSLRLVADGRVVADEVIVQRLAAHETPAGLTDATRAALHYANLYMSEPTRIDGGVRAWLLAHYSREQLVELTLDLTAWNWQKVLVALDLDRAADPTRLSGVVINTDGTMSRVGALPTPV